MLQVYSRIHEHFLKKNNFHAYATKTYLKGKPLPLGTFVLKRIISSHVHFSDKLSELNPFGLDHTNYLADYMMLHMNFLHKMVPYSAFKETN